MKTTFNARAVRPSTRPRGLEARFAFANWNHTAMDAPGATYTQHHRARHSAMHARLEEERAEERAAWDASSSVRSSEGRGGADGGSADGGSAGDASPDRTWDSGSSGSYYAVLNVPRSATEEVIKRAYRHLVQTVHPDKIQNPDHKQAAEKQFIRIQTAYDVLKDERSRAVYDVYGEAGLQAGMELSEFVGTAGGVGRNVGGDADAQRRLFEEFLRQREQREGSLSATKGVYVFKTDATAALAPHRGGGHVPLSRMPHITTVYMSTGVDVPIDTAEETWLPAVLSSQQDSLHLGGMVMTAPHGSGGGGSFVAGYHRFYANGVQAGVEGSIGLQTLAGLSVSVPLVETVVANAGVQCDWSAGEGRVVSWDVGTSKQLGEHTSAEFAWTVWPLEVSTMSFTLKHKVSSGVRWLNDIILMGKLELGAMTGLTVRLVRQLTDVLSGRASFKASVTQGIEVELGGFGRIGAGSHGDVGQSAPTAGLGVVTALPAGVMLRLRFQKSGHNFEFPILLSPVLDPYVIAGAHIFPPAIIYAVLHGIVSPAARALHNRRTSVLRAKQIESVQRELKSSLEAIEMIRHVAERKMRREAELLSAPPSVGSDQAGLVIAKALYGDAELLKDDRIQVETFDACIVRSPEDIVQRGITCVDVTIPVAYACDKSSLEFHAGFPKSKLFGFFDPCPGREKVLVIFYRSAGRWLRVQLADTEGCRLPGGGRGRGMVLDAADAIVQMVLEPSLREYLDS
jgi:DnaJ family protein C protein 11